MECCGQQLCMPPHLSACNGSQCSQEPVAGLLPLFNKQMGPSCTSLCAAANHFPQSRDMTSDTRERLKPPDVHHL